MSELNLDEIRARADVVQSRHCMAEGEVAAWALATDDVPALLVEVDRLRRERDGFREAALLYAAMVAELNETIRGGESDA